MTRLRAHFPIDKPNLCVTLPGMSDSDDRIKRTQASRKALLSIRARQDALITTASAWLDGCADEEGEGEADDVMGFIRASLDDQVLMTAGMTYTLKCSAKQAACLMMFAQIGVSQMLLEQGEVEGLIHYGSGD